MRWSALKGASAPRLAVRRIQRETPKAMSNVRQRTRPYLPTSSSEFALPLSKSRSHNSLDSQDDPDDPHPLLFRRFRRPSLPTSTNTDRDSRLSSPLAHEAFAPLPRSSLFKLETDQDQDRMWTDNSPSCSSENATPPLLGSTASEKDVETDSDSPMKTSRPHTPPRQSTSNIDGLGEPSPFYQTHLRRLSCPVRLCPLFRVVQLF